MELVATAAQMKELDRQAIEEYGIASLELMERAAQAVAKTVERLLLRQGRSRGARASGLIYQASDAPPTPEQAREQASLEAIVQSAGQESLPRIGVLCGPGNNGGDGVAAARLLLERGFPVRAFFVGDRTKMSRDQRAMAEKLAQAGGELEDFDPLDARQRTWLHTCGCLVDALFGVGLSRPVEGDFRAAVGLMQDSPLFCRVVSCDIPSGIHADTGAVLGAAVHAGVTVTFTCAKPGHFLGDGAEYTGVLEVEDIGIPRQLLRSREAQARFPVQTMGGELRLPRRRPNSHKGDYGRLFLLAGSEGYTGAPVLAAAGAVRTGAGLVFLGVPREIYPIVAVKCSSAMPFPLPERYPDILAKARGCGAALIGPGLGSGPKAARLALSLLEDLDCPVVLDADGINALAGHIDSLDRRRAPTVLTPHDGEFARLTGQSLPLEGRLEAARDFARAHRCILVLKGHRTITAGPDGRAFLNTSGNPGMARGGSGDVLSGVITSLLGQKQLVGSDSDLTMLTAAAVYIHGAAGDAAAEQWGEYGMTPEDLIRCLPAVMERQLVSRGMWPAPHST